MSETVAHKQFTAGHDEQSGTVTVSLESQWLRVKEQLRIAFDDAVYNSWFKPMAPVNLEQHTLVMAVPTRFIRDWLKSNYLDRILQYWQQENPTIQVVDLMVVSGFSASSSQEGDNAPEKARVDAAAQTGAKSAATSRYHAQTALPVGAGDVSDEIGAPLDTRFTFDSFVIGKSNELAYAAAQRVAESSTVNFNPLFLHGGVGLGKTHLMHAIAWHIREQNPERKVIYLSAEKFMYQFISALRYKDTMSFKQKFRSVDVLMIDDVQFIANKNSTQEEFFHTFNTLVDHNRQVIISADRSPSDLEGIEERIRSRLGWGLVADIHPTDYELRLGILQQKLESIGDVQIQPDVLEFLARRIASNVRELEGALNRLVAHTTLVGRAITIDVAQDVLQDLLRANDRRITLEDIQRKVADYYNIRLSDMMSARRARQGARPRQVAMYLAKLLTSKSLPDIGRGFGGRDHTTVMHAVKRIEELCQTDSVLEEDLLHLRRILEG
ncbi:MAG: chromosomal replication initiator protein DnaA [Kordiimonas sp.]|nr:chromosomal replication initiator protein DnaA [Kordiimonas sp.]